MCMLTYTHVPAHTGTHSGVSFSRVHAHARVCSSHTHMCLHIQARPQTCAQVYPCAHFRVCTLMYTRMRAHKCTTTGVHSDVHTYTRALLCTLPLLFMAHGSVSTPLSRLRGQEAGAPGAQRPPLTWQQGGSIPIHQQAPPISTCFERPLTYTGPADFIFLLHA